MNLDKTELRQMTINKLKAFTENERHDIEENMLKTLIQSSLWKNAQTIGITVSHGFEWDTTNIIKKAWEQGKQVCVPKCLPKNRKMIFYQIDNFDQLEVVYYNLLEPKPDETTPKDKKFIDLIVVPGVVFDKKGYRIGFGGGYYDRYLANYKNETVSLLHTKQLINRIPIDNHDIAVKYLLTEKGFVG